MNTDTDPTGRLTLDLETLLLHPQHHELVNALARWHGEL
jgi:hypothetical protein